MTQTQTDIKLTLTNYKIACDNLAKAVNKHLFGGSRDWYWIADTIGGIAAFGNTDYICDIDMVLILENDVTYDQYKEWEAINYKSGSKGYITLKEWINDNLKHLK